MDHEIPGKLIAHLLPGSVRSPVQSVRSPV